MHVAAKLVHMSMRCSGTIMHQPVWRAAIMLARDIAGHGWSNPVGTRQAAAMLLVHIGHHTAAGRVRQAVMDTLHAGILTPDLGGTATTKAVTGRVIAGLEV